MSKEIKLSHQARWAFIITLLTGTFTMSISQSALSTAYPTLMKYFSVSASTIQWLTTGFMLIMTVMIPVSPWLLANINFKSLYLSLLLVFDLGTLLIVMASSFQLMMLGRVLEAIAVGVLFPAYQTVLLNITPKNQRGSIMGLAGLVMGSALAVGPIISGVVLRFFKWQGVFVFFMIVITLVLLEALKFIISPLELHPSKLDWISAFSAISFIGFLYVLTQWGKTLVWNSNLIIILIASFILLGIFVMRQLTASKPMLQLRVLKTFNFDLALLLTGFSYIALIVVTIIFPLYYQNVLHLSAFWSGLALVPGAVILSVLNPLTGRMADKFGFKVTLIWGMSMIALGWCLLAILNQQLNLIILILIAALIEGGNAFVMMPAVTMGANSLPKEYIADGTAVITTIRQILGSVGVSVATLLLSLPAMGATEVIKQQQQFHLVFIVFSIIEIIGLVFALVIRNAFPKHD
ncbi:DHA2 family efflux MFS transporter permease subunit [Bombilactobacillus bombi]|uniref:DHA2 family efflux MFS transporter permease subunit n=1 Tax=Bombilactobacillus bombi TaxID=1303590 RepID=UPI0015E6278D|nr:DHA2 family efflux MFS transporter permease subunit [Bombilactobacillus bombi]MBA1434555.1 DHA2 family efflux MFS transporter permease subunit [Bombilactobacillus bombi]